MEKQKNFALKKRAVDLGQEKNACPIQLFTMMESVGQCKYKYS